MLPSQRWRGIWNAGWEWSNFCPYPAATCSVSFEKNEIDLRIDSSRFPEAKQDGTFEIEFVGRRTKIKGHYGHLGQYPQMMIVDRLIGLKKLKEAQD